MRGFEWARIFTAVLIAVALGVGTRFVATALMEPAALEKTVPQDAAAVDPVSPLLAKADTAHGAKLARLCSGCHSFDPDGATRVGPNLWNIVNAPHASRENYTYSKALKAFPGLWDYESLNRFLYRPMQDVPGTKMGYPGLRRAQDRADLIAWLRTQADDPAPLP